MKNKKVSYIFAFKSKINKIFKFQIYLKHVVFKFETRDHSIEQTNRLSKTFNNKLGLLIEGAIVKFNQ